MMETLGDSSNHITTMLNVYSLISSCDVVIEMFHPFHSLSVHIGRCYDNE